MEPADAIGRPRPNGSTTALAAAALAAVLLLAVPSLAAPFTAGAAQAAGLPGLPGQDRADRDAAPWAPDAGGPAPGDGGDAETFNGVSSWAPANEDDAPVFRQFAFVEDIVTQYHVLKPKMFLTDLHTSNAYNFPACPDLSPVFSVHEPEAGDGGFQGAHDALTRQLVDVVLADCSEQPTSEAEVLDRALAVNERPGFFVNAPIVPGDMVELSDEELFNGPPYRPRVTAYQAGEEVTFITYEASWYPSWANTAWPNPTDADVFIISYGPLFEEGFTILNSAVGTPHHESMDSYSPIWRGNCIVDADDPRCNSVTLEDPAYFQCRSVAECLSMTNSNGNPVEVISPTGFTHINCPMVAADLDGDDHIDEEEEFVFPDLWVHGPVIV